MDRFKEFHALNRVFTPVSPKNSVKAGGTERFFQGFQPSFEKN